VHRAHPLERGTPCASGDLSRSAGDENDVGRRDLLDRALGQDAQHPVVGGNRTGLGRDEGDARARQAAQHLIRPDGIKGGEAVIEENRDVHVLVSLVRDE
jgi:hypothetical protein